MRLLPRDEHFFAMFAELSARLTSSAALLDQLFKDPARLAEHVARIKEVEHEADTVTYEIITRLNKTFVTPLDREDIHLLASRLDNVIDLLDGAARRAAMFRITETKPAAGKITEILVEAAACIGVAVADIRKPRIVVEQNRRVKRLEEKGDTVYQDAVAALFEGSPDPLEVMKWKEMLDKLEDALDACEDVSNMLESIALKHS